MWVYLAVVVVVAELLGAAAVVALPLARLQLAARPRLRRPLAAPAVLAAKVDIFLFKSIYSEACTCIRSHGRHSRAPPRSAAPAATAAPHHSGCVLPSPVIDIE